MDNKRRMKQSSNCKAHQLDESSHKKESDLDLKYQTRKSCFCIFTFLPFLAWPTDQRTKYLQNRCA